jgi:hypothetical protein
LITKFVIGCLDEGDPSMEEFPGNKPILPVRFIADDNQRPIMGILLTFWFHYFRYPEAIKEMRIQEYVIHQIEIGEWKDRKFVARVTFSVKPEKTGMDMWWKNTAKRNWNWVRRKMLFSIIKEKGNYRVQSTRAT